MGITRVAAARGGTALAGGGFQAGFRQRQLLRQAVVRQHQVALVRLVAPAHGGGVGLGDAPDVPRESLGQGLQRGRLGDEGADLVQVGQAPALELQAQRLLAHLVLQPPVERLQRLRHVVEAGGEFAELVAGVHLHAGGEIAGLHLRQSRRRRATGLSTNR